MNYYYLMSAKYETRNLGESFGIQEHHSSVSEPVVQNCTFKTVKLLRSQTVSFLQISTNWA